MTNGLSGYSHLVDDDEKEDSKVVAQDGKCHSHGSPNRSYTGENFDDWCH